MGNKRQVDLLKALVAEQQEHIKKLEQEVSFLNAVIKQYESEIASVMSTADTMTNLCSERLAEASSLCDDYKRIISEATQIKSEYDASLAELISSIRSRKRR